MVRLIVAEKPSVARDIAKVVGANERRSGFLASKSDWVTWCVGHLVELVEPHEYAARFKSWRFDDLPILPREFKLRPIAQTEDQFRVLTRLLTAAEVDEVVNACDAGREGELIFRQVYQLAGSTKRVRRLWISALTDEAIGKGMANLSAGTDFDALGDAARSRAEADWLVGINATRALTLLGRRGSGRGDLLSVGRVQTPTLAMLVRREDEIEAFVPQPFWQVKALFETEVGERYLGLYTKAKVDRFEDKAKAEAVLAEVAGGAGRVLKVTEKKHAEPPPLLFDLTELQKVCNRRFGFSAQQTLDLAQSLYETHKVLTYPRTDARYLSSDQKGELEPLIKKLAVGPYAPFATGILGAGKLRLKRVINDAEVGDHPAIIPTGVLPGKNRLSADERRVFDLVIRRFLAAFMPDAEFARTRVETGVGKHRFLSKGQVCMAPGWQAVEPPASKRSDDDEQSLPKLQKDQPVQVAEAKLHEGKTQPPKRYSEAALLGAMERAGRELEEAELRRAMKESGLGTPATRAGIIETLLRRGYVERQKKVLVPTPKGRQLVAAIPVDELLSPELTGRWEARLSKIAEGEEKRDGFMQDVAHLTKQLIGQIRGAKPLVIPPTPIGTCPRCREGSVIPGRRGWGCSRWRESCRFVIWYAYDGVRIPEAEARRLLTSGTSGEIPELSEGGPARLRVDLETPEGIRLEPISKETHATER